MKRYVQIGQSRGDVVSAWVNEDNTICYVQTVAWWFDRKGWQKVGQIDNPILHGMTRESRAFLLDALNVKP